MTAKHKYPSQEETLLLNLCGLKADVMEVAHKRAVDATTLIRNAVRRELRRLRNKNAEIEE